VTTQEHIEAEFHLPQQQQSAIPEGSFSAVKVNLPVKGEKYYNEEHYQFVQEGARRQNRPSYYEESRLVSPLFASTPLHHLVVHWLAPQ